LTSFVRKLERVGKEVKQDLKVSSLISIDHLDEIKVIFAIYFCLHLDLQVFCGTIDHLKSFKDYMRHVEIVLTQRKTLRLHLG
jgi:hypothetical protein